MIGTTTLAAGGLDDGVGVAVLNVLSETADDIDAP